MYKRQAIDGFASTGKSTLAKMLSKFIGLPYIDSGALFRGITFLALEKGWIVNNIIDEISIEEGLQEVKISFDSLTNSLNLNKRDITDEIRSKSVSSNVSQISKLVFVRSFLLKQQRLMGDSYGLIMDGRDIGTVVFPDADFKFFLFADSKVRAERRLKQINDKSVKLESIEKEIKNRDNTDSTRKIAPLKKADDAYEIDVTSLNINQVFNKILQKINSR